MKKIYIKIVLLLTSIIIVGGCTKDNTIEPTIDKIKIAEAQLSAGRQLTIWSDQQLTTGFATLHLQVKNNQGVPMQPPLSLHPLMDMGSMQHSAPYQQVTYNNKTESYQSQLIFTMPSSEYGNWSLVIKIGQEEVKVPISVEAAPKGNTRVKTFVAQDNKKYVLALVSLLQPKSGINNLELLVYRQVTAFEFVPVENLTIHCKPEMLSMGHGSPNNSDPLSVGKGYYKGAVNFTMSGDWRLSFVIKNGEQLLSDVAYLDVLF